MVTSRAAVVFLVTFVIVALSDYAYGGDVAGPSFGYTPGTPTGPGNWGKLSPAYWACGVGKRQSPINIVTRQAVSAPRLDSLTRTYADVNATITNDGHDIKMSFPGKVGVVMMNGKLYDFISVHWHSPSEHMINGQKFPLEMHLVHKSKDNNLAVIAILYQLGAPDSFYFQIKGKLAELARDRCNFAWQYSQVVAGLVRMQSLQKRTGNYFRYLGSLTTPPCTENVVWNVLGKVRQLSKEQLAMLTAALPTRDDRPAQPLNGRIVQFYNPPNSSYTPGVRP